jgi:hypothetical protein
MGLGKVAEADDPDRAGQRIGIRVGMTVNGFDAHGLLQGGPGSRGAF